MTNTRDTTEHESSQGREPEEPVAVPHTELEPEVLRAVVESFVLREGTDYGAHEASLEEKVAAVLAQLRRREARIMFDPRTDSVTIVRI